MTRALALLAITSTALAQQPDVVHQPDVAPTTRVLNCTIAGCHTDVTQTPFLHGPVAAGACITCHEYDSPDRHTFVPKREGEQQCAFCHIGKTDSAGLLVHEPVEEGKCLECHDPHGAANRLMLSASSVAENCITCHETIPHDEGTLNHTPVQEGDCLACHRAHSSLHENLLITSEQDLCVECHEAIHGHALDTPKPWQGVDLTFGAANAVRTTWRELLPGELVYETGVERCADCHAHHASDHPNLLRDETINLCSTCHEQITSIAQNAPVQHPGVTDEAQCMNCHAPHDSDTPGLLRDKPIRLCATCHNDSESPVENKSEWMTAANMPGSVAHGHIRDDCTQCHTVHGGLFRSLLAAKYTEKYYQPYQRSEYALCFQCHDTNMIEQEQTPDATEFRNGSRNLHYVHVVKDDRKGRSCRACHTPHVSSSPKLLEFEVPFGEWMVPIKFQQNASGGSCAAGCHRDTGYDRINPITTEILKDPNTTVPPEGARPQGPDR